MPDTIEDLMVRWAGSNYAKPRKITVDSNDLDELIAALVAFKKKNAGMTFSRRERETDCSSYLIGFDAERLETPQEVSVRVEGYRQHVLGNQTRRRQEYERLKREFGDA